ncbi:hypothetical protein GQ457_09G027860 [Hibiscus cannabinus]
MVSEIPVVRVAADGSSSSAVRDSKPFTNKSISIRLDETNYLLWRQQILFTIESLDLSSHIDGTSVVPPQCVLVNGEKVPNPQFASFKQQDSALCSWLLASISLSILPSLVSCRTAFEIWEKVQQIFSVSSTTKIMHLHCSLKNLRKRDQGMREYLAQIQSVCDSLAACGNPLSETMHISAILSGLPSEYEPVVAVITSSQQPYKLDGVCGVLLDTESRLQETHSANLIQNSNLGYDGYQFGSTRGGSNMFFDQSYYPFGSGVFWSPKFCFPESFFGFKILFTKSFSRGGRGRFFGGRSRPQCQLCGRIGHLVNRCYYRFDQSYDGYSVNLVEEVADCPKAEGESFHQEGAGAAAFVSDDFSPIVCEDSAWFPDSGATAHLTPDLSKFITSSPYTGSGKITVANGMVVPISRIGRSSLATDSRSLFLSNLSHVPCVNKNLLSVSRFTKDNNVSVEFFPNSCVVKDLGTQQVMLRGLESNGLYKFFSMQDAAGQFPKLSLVSSSVQDRAGYSSTIHVPPPLSSELKFPAKLLVYQRRPKVLLPEQQVVSSSTLNQQTESLFCQYNELLPPQQTGSLFLISQHPQFGSSQQHGESHQAELTVHQGSSSGFSASSNFSVGNSQLRETSSPEIYKEVSEVSQGSSSSAVSNVKAGCHPMLTHSKTGSLKNKVCFSAVAYMEIAEPKTVQQALASKEWSGAVHKEYDALVQKGTWEAIDDLNAGSLPLQPTIVEAIVNVIAAIFFIYSMVLSYPSTIKDRKRL